MPHPYSENHLVEEPAAALLSELGWEAVSAQGETFGAQGSFGRERRSEVVLPKRLRAALERLNPAASPEAINQAMDELSRDRTAMSLVAANREVHSLLKDGVSVSVPDPARGGQKIERVHVVDWERPAANDFLAVRQMTFQGVLYSARPDLVCFVNGLPWVVIELKKPGVPARVAFDDNLTSYKEANSAPGLFAYNAFLVASNGGESRLGSVTADWNRFFEWKRIDREDEPRRVSLEVVIRGTLAPARLLDLVESFSLFSETPAGTEKILAQNHQYLGVNNVIASALSARRKGDGRGGVFWQTQGSGKSYSMVFFAQKILRKITGDWRFVIVTDRKELDDQIAGTFKATGSVSEAEGDECHAQSGAHLRQLLSENHRYVFTLIHKFQTPEVLYAGADVIVIVDEAHRSQYDTLALNMRAALPGAQFVAFTGTPLLDGGERTREIFGEYVSRYDFQQSVEDNATVPLYYENRARPLKIENPDLNEELYALIEAADLDEEGEKKVERELGRNYHLITRDDRLEKVAADIVRHYVGRGFQGKAMVVSIDKATALKMHDKVKKHWPLERARVEAELAKSLALDAAPDPARVSELRRQLETFDRVEMALVVSAGQNEIEQMKRLGLDIEPHRKRMNEEALDRRFKDPKDPLALVFVCAMWLTGFDAPSCSTIYLDKPMRNHTLMQTIARANRVFGDKHNGLIVDYANVFASLEKALAMYAPRDGSERPVRDKEKLVDELRQAVRDAETFCAAHGSSLTLIEKAAPGTMERLGRVDAAVNTFISPDPLRKDFLAHERLVATLFNAVKPDTAALAFASKVACLATIAASIREQLHPGTPDVSKVMAGINSLLDRSISAKGFEIGGHDKDPWNRGVMEDGSRAAGPGVIDISKIDFEALQKRFADSPTKNIDLERLKAAIRSQLERLVKVNPTRADYLARFEELIASYNNGSRTIADTMRELFAMTRAATDEEKRHVRENLTEEELTVFDLLTRPGPELTVAERDEVKKVARNLLSQLKSVVALDWRRRTDGRAKVAVLIEATLDDGLPRAYSTELYQEKCKRVFEHCCGGAGLG